MSGHLWEREVIGRGVMDKGLFALGFDDQAGVRQVEKRVIQAEVSKGKRCKGVKVPGGLRQHEGPMQGWKDGEGDPGTAGLGQGFTLEKDLKSGLSNALSTQSLYCVC